MRHSGAPGHRSMLRFVRGLGMTEPPQSYLIENESKYSLVETDLRKKTPTTSINLWGLPTPETTVCVSVMPAQTSLLDYMYITSTNQGWSGMASDHSRAPHTRLESAQMTKRRLPTSPIADIEI